MFSLLKGKSRYNPPSGPPPSIQKHAPPPGPPPGGTASGTHHYQPPLGHPPSDLRYNPPQGPPPLPPPQYAAGSGTSHEASDLNATEDDYEVADLFCERNPAIFLAKIVSTEDRALDVDQWGLVSRAADAHLERVPRGPVMRSIHIEKMEKSHWRGLNHHLLLLRRDTTGAHYENRGDACLTSNLPIIAGQYSTVAKRGVYFEVKIHNLNMKKGGTAFALGMQCLPYPPNRLPGWHRRSAALHLDDRRIYHEDSEGGSDYKHNGKDNVPEFVNGDVVGCGYEFSQGAGGVGHLFYTYNGKLLPIALRGVFDSRNNEPEVDVFAAIGITNSPCDFDVNFGHQDFKWAGPSHFQNDKGFWKQAEWTVKGIFNELADAPPPEYVN
ncbi:hypothetical protein B0H15DRAFT_904803 [Mycena belliarum]|uniref:SPRY domain-containing protein n=1 Tax=Mycena belliarum TaxID=1033014 RepID=A0AAD6U8B6_9AGAR|nr:hypothetical protein B0H15DRAFT_904803 [Mycena belliae]